MMQKRILSAPGISLGIFRGIFCGVCLAILAGCAGTDRITATETDWLTITDIRQIAAMREDISKPSLRFDDMIIIRMKTESENRVEVTSIAPSVISARKDGSPAARTTFALTQKRDILALFTQDVPNLRAFRKEIPISELTPGKAFSFPVVQESGEVQQQTFTIEKIITQ